MITVIVVAIVAGAAGFFAGKYMQSQSATRQFGFGNGQGGARQAGANGGRFRPVTGAILSADANSITVKLSDGSTKIVLITGSTQINKAQTASQSDLTTGAQVAVFGSNNADGSVTAQNIQLNPLQMRGGGTPQATPTAGM